MAFTKGKGTAGKFTKKAVTKSPANYARKKAQEEVEEVEEVEVDEVEEQEGDNVQDDYDNEEETPAPRRSFSNQSGRSGARSQAAQREPGKALRLTGMFAGKREGCFSGKLRDEDAENLKGLIEEAQSSGQQVVFFLWENQGNPQFSLTANISAPFKKGFGGQNRGNGGWRGNAGTRPGGNFNRGFRRY